MNKISIEYLKKLKACEKGIYWFKDNFGNEEYTIDELLNLVKENDIVSRCQNVSWFIQECKSAQTQEMLDYYLSLKPNYEDVRWLIEKCKLAQTQEMIDYYLSLNPDYINVRWFIRNCEYAKNNEKLQKYLDKIKKDGY